MDYCPLCSSRLVKVEQTGPGSFKATDQDTGLDVPIPANVAESYARAGKIPVSYACVKGKPTSYRGVVTAAGVYSRSGAQHVDGKDHCVKTADELPGERVEQSHFRSVNPFAADVNARTVRVN